MAESNDASTEFMAHRQDIAATGGAGEMAEWLRRQEAPPTPRPGSVMDQPKTPFPTDKPVPADPSMAGTIMRSVGELPRQVMGGIDDAARNALQFMNPLTDWLDENVADLKYDPVSAPKTAAGAVTRSLSQFLTGFLPATKALKGIGIAGKILNPTVAGMVADFATRDGHEGRLADLWNAAGLPKNVLTDFLAADPTDTEFEGRLKNTLEGAGFGLATEGVMLGARALRAAKKAAPAIASERALLKAKYGELTDDAIKATIGDPSKPMVQTVVKPPPAAVGKMAKATKETATATADEVTAYGLVDAGDSKVFVNFARIDGPDDVKSMIGTMADRFKGSVDEARRGTISLEETQRMADELGMDVTDLLARRKGQPLNAEEALAARRIWSASAEKLVEAARKASGPGASALDQFAFRRMMAVHHAIQSEVIGARTETARALSSWRIPVGGGIERARAVEQMMQAMGGPEAAGQMAKRLAMLAEFGANPAAIARFAEKGFAATSLDAVREVWINGLLSSPATHIVNSTSNLFVAFQQMYERKAAASIGNLRGTHDGVVAGEALAQAYGMISSIKDAFRLSWQALKTGESGFALNKVDLPVDHAVSAHAFQISSETGLGRAIDLIGNVARIPGRMLGAEDEFFKTIGYRMELHAQVLRQAVQEGHHGPALQSRIAQLLIDTPENLRIAAADAALYQTFNSQPGVIGQAMMRLRTQMPAASFVLPFVRTPVNIARYAFERSPLAPLVSQWRADIAAGGARADLALSRMATGSVIMAMAADWADSGIISGQGPGPTDKGQREAMTRQGWQPYSIKVGDRWYSYNRTDPLGMTMGFAADIAEAVRHGELQEDDVDEVGEVMGMAIAAVSQVTINKTYLRGVSELANMLTDGRRYGPDYVENLVSSFLPFTALAGAVERGVDPTVRERNSVADAVYGKIAGLSSSLPPKRNLWGEEIRSESGLGKVYDFLSPVQSREVKPTPIDTEIMRLADARANDWDAAPPQRIGKKTFFDGVHVNLKEWPDVYDEYVRLAGNGLNHPAWGMGLKDYLNAVVSGNHPMSAVYRIQPDEMKLTFISKAVRDYRQAAQQQILNDPRFAEFSRTVQQMKMDRMQRRLPEGVE